MDPSTETEPEARREAFTEPPPPTQVKDASTETARVRRKEAASEPDPEHQMNEADLHRNAWDELQDNPEVTESAKHTTRDLGKKNQEKSTLQIWQEHNHTVALFVARAIAEELDPLIHIEGYKEDT